MRKLKYLIGPCALTFLILFIYKHYILDHLPLNRGLQVQSRQRRQVQNGNKKGLEIKQKLFPCEDFTAHKHYGQRGSYWVLYNYVAATKRPLCDQSITYTTHSDYRFLDNLVPLVERWRGPISISIYAPGSDFQKTLLGIQYLRVCTSPLIMEWVNFHIFFDSSLMPAKVPKTLPKLSKIKCPKIIPPFGSNSTNTFRNSKKLVYPVNMARNLARDMAPTHYVLSSDIELYPSPNLIPQFLEMLQNTKDPQNPLGRKKSNSTNPVLWVLPIFEIAGTIPLTELPEDKGELQVMLKDKLAIPFHKSVCGFCHKIPSQAKWIEQEYEEGEGLKVFDVGKRVGSFRNWEPIYIGTKLDPRYDERLNWEGQRDKMTQGYILCVLDYEFYILNTPFLIHRPGIKKFIKKTKQQVDLTPQQNTVIKYSILPELKVLYGQKKGCEA